jgi:RNA recognition motif-containing protein
LTNIFVGNLPFSAGEEDLEQMFSPYGEIQRVHVVRDRETQRSRGFAFVEMPDDGAAQNAITALNGKDMRGRAVRVNAAEPREARPPRRKF